MIAVGLDIVEPAAPVAARLARRPPHHQRRRIRAARPARQHRRHPHRAGHGDPTRPARSRVWPSPEDDPDAIQHTTDWTAEALASHRDTCAAPFDDGPDGPAATIHAVQQGSPEGTRISLDVGAHRITAAHVLRAITPNQILQSNGFSSMGTGLPGAITSRLVDPKTPAVALTGDAGLWMTLESWASCRSGRSTLWWCTSPMPHSA